MLRQFLSKRMLVAMIVISIVLGAFAICQTADSYADDMPTTTLVQIGAKKTAKANWYLQDEDKNWQNYTLETPVKRVIKNEQFGPYWALLKTELAECGPITKITLSKEDGIILDYIEAENKTVGLQKSDFEKHLDIWDDPFYGLAEDRDPELESFDHNFYYISGIAESDIAPVKQPLGDYFEIQAPVGEVRDTFNHIITLYFNGAEDAPVIPEEVQAVIDEIDKIGEITEANYLSKESDIKAARDAYDKLETNELKEQVTNRDDLFAAEAAYDDFKLAAAKTVAINELEGAFDKSDYSGEELIKLEQAIEDGKTAITAATSVKAVDVAKNNALDKARKAKTDAQIAEEALLKAKDDAKKEIDDKYDLTQYSGEEKAKIEKAIADAKSAIDAAETLEAVTQAKNNGIAEADKAKTDTQIADEKKAEIAKKKATAKKYTVKGLKVKVKSRKFTVSWKKTAGATGYQVQYKLKSAKKYKNLKTLKKLKVTSKKLKKGKKYQFKVRTYTNVNGTKVYGKWSSVKTCKCK